MKITRDVRDYEAEHGLNEEAALQEGIKEKAASFVASGSKICQKTKICDIVIYIKSFLTIERNSFLLLRETGSCIPFLSSTNMVPLRVVMSELIASIRTMLLR